MSKISDERQTNAELVNQLRSIVDRQGEVAVVIVQRELFNRAIGRIAETLRSGREEKNGVGVKPLEWGKTSYGTPEAVTIAWTYRINGAWNGGFTVTRNSTVLAADDGRTNFATEAEAKAAAQADFERRILSALTNTDLSLRAENERLKAQVEALMTERTSLIETKREQIERLTKERDAAVEAEDEAKECYWAVYPTYVAVHGEGMSAEAAHTDLSARATTAEAKLEEAAKVLEPWANLADAALAEAPHDAFHLQAFVDSTGTVHMISLDHARSTKSFLANLKGAE